MAHNARSYDLHLILKGLTPLLVTLPTKIRNGQQILQMTLRRLCFEDSLNFIPYPVKAFPKSFGLKELKKGYFPHFFNTEANQTYRGPYPPAVMYDPDGMSLAERTAFLQWHTQKVQEGALFDFQGELLAYCQSDVDILRRGCADFRQNAINSVDMDPFVEVITAAAFTMKSFRKHDLKPNTIAILPPQGYQPKRNYSQACMHWPHYLMETDPHLHLQHARNGGEKEFTCGEGQHRYSVDGYDPATGTIYEFLGCFWHGCQACHKTEHSPCKHTDEERSWAGTYATIELQEAVKKYDYQVLQIYDVWHFDTFAQHDPDTQQVGLFDTYIDRHFKEKLEASGYPEGCTDHDADIREIYDKEGIGLDKDCIEKNPGRRTIAKMQLNSLWGKFGQRLDYSQIIYMNDPVQYLALWRNERNTIEDVTVVNEHTVEVTYTQKKELQTPHSHFNVAITAWVTAQARLKLYEILALVGRRVLYFDTDSVIYIHRPHDANPEPGHSLGEFTDELDGNTIKTFVSGGPKNYGYELMNPRPDGTMEV
ncbi:uncharacterized protein [Haliotis cracherodii]|uniref:uncharacterized protein n=1 Tax=Haliotis cracherodii TaxID=6455 RepID=UPI0039E8EEA9